MQRGRAVSTRDHLWLLLIIFGSTWWDLARQPMGIRADAKQVCLCKKAPARWSDRQNGRPAALPRIWACSWALASCFANRRRCRPPRYIQLRSSLSYSGCWNVELLRLPVQPFPSSLGCADSLQARTRSCANLRSSWQLYERGRIRLLPAVCGESFSTWVWVKLLLRKPRSSVVLRSRTSEKSA